MLFDPETAHSLWWAFDRKAGASAKHLLTTGGTAEGAQRVVMMSTLASACTRSQIRGEGRKRSHLDTIFERGGRLEQGRPRDAIRQALGCTWEKFVWSPCRNRLGRSPMGFSTSHPAMSPYCSDVDQNGERHLTSQPGGHSGAQTWRPDSRLAADPGDRTRHPMHRFRRNFPRRCPDKRKCMCRRLRRE